MLSVWCADRSVSPLGYCVAAIGREAEISSNLIKHGEENKQLFRQHTLLASMHYNSEALLGYCTRLPVSLCMFVCVWCYLPLGWSTVLNKQSSAGAVQGQLRSASNARPSHIRHVSHWHMRAHTKSTLALQGCAQKTFHQTHLKRKYSSPRGEQRGLGKLILIWKWREIMGLRNCPWIWICFSFQNVNSPYQDFLRREG